MNFDLPIGYGEVDFAPSLAPLYTGLTKDNMISYLKKQLRIKDLIIADLQNKNDLSKEQNEFHK